ncbi:MAG: hypothetical protein SFW64_07655 [Alphaproteobacteria bacterium]|nr:hypothetical protein [Alphaproteobacteria bacterium]
METQHPSQETSQTAFCPFRFRAAKTAKIQIVLVLYIALVFVQSLFFKFSGAPETQFIFATLDAWAAGLGFPGLFAPGGIFAAKVIASAELVAALLLLISLPTRRVILRVAGAALALGIISGAIFFHLFTPLGINVADDGGTLFVMATGVWLSAAALLLHDRAFIFKIFRH